MMCNGCEIIVKEQKAKAEEEERQAKEREALERAKQEGAREEAERRAREKEEKRIRDEQEKREREEEERIAQEKAAMERAKEEEKRAIEEAERRAREEEERRAREEAERRAREEEERIAREEAERIKREEEKRGVKRLSRMDRILILTRELQQIPVDAYNIKDVLRQGSNGISFVAEVNVAGQNHTVALKMVFNYKELSSTNLNLKNEYENELKILKSEILPAHPGVIKYLFDFTAAPTNDMLNQVAASVIDSICTRNRRTGQTQPNVTQFFVLEHHTTTLEQKLEALGNSITPTQILHFSRQICRALKFLFDNKILNLGVKLSNILVSDEDEIILSYFGESLMTDENYCCSRAELRGGNQQFTAPEILNQISDARKNEIDFAGQWAWEAGYLMYEIALGEFPFRNYPSYQASSVRVPKPDFSEADPDLPKEFVNLIEQLLANDPKQRISIADACTILDLGAGDQASYSNQLLRETNVRLTDTERKLREACQKLNESSNRVSQLLDEVHDKNVEIKELQVKLAHHEASEKVKRTLILTRQLQLVPFDKIRVIKVLGQGCFGIVFLVEVELKQETVQLALKMIVNLGQIVTAELSNFKNEFSILHKLMDIHPNIICILHEFSNQPTQDMLAHLHDATLVMKEKLGRLVPVTTKFFFVEYHPTTLQQLLEKRKLTPQEIYKFAGELLSCLCFLYDNHIVHRDVKPDNILVSASGSLILNDFGESIETDENHCCATINIGAGNVQYTAPEVQNQRAAQLMVDFSKQYPWDAGCILYTMIFGHFPFRDYPAKYGNPPQLSVPDVVEEETTLDPEFMQIVYRMIATNHQYRISILDAHLEFAKFMDKLIRK